MNRQHIQAVRAQINAAAQGGDLWTLRRLLDEINELRAEAINAEYKAKQQEWGKQNGLKTR